MQRQTRTDLEEPEETKESVSASNRQKRRSSTGDADGQAKVKSSLKIVDTEDDDDDFLSVELSDDMPSVIKPLPEVDEAIFSGGRGTRPLHEMIEDVEREEKITFENFKRKQMMRKYEREDYRVKAFLMLITNGQKKKVWMPSKLVFDKRGGKYSDRVAGLG